MNHKYVKCTNHFLDGPCNWISFEVSWEVARNWVYEFNEWFKTQDDETKSHYGGKGASLEQYAKCPRCGGGYKNFVDATEEEEKKIYGSTIGPVGSRHGGF